MVLISSKLPYYQKLTIYDINVAKVPVKNACMYRDGAPGGTTPPQRTEKHEFTRQI